MASADRDQSIEALLRRQREADLQSMEPCVDAEVLAAWVDGGLTGDALAAAEKHAAGCPRCQALLASMARTAPDVVDRPWWRTLTSKWLVPVAAIATALAVWVAVDRNSRESPSAPAVTDPARAVQSAPASVSPPPSTPPSVADNKSDQIASTPARGAGGGSASDESVNRQKAAAELQQHGGVAGGVGGGRTADSIQPLRDRAEAAAAPQRSSAAAAPPPPSPAAPPPPATAVAASGPPLPVTAGEAKLGTPASAPAKPATQTVADASKTAAAMPAAGLEGGALKSGTTEIASPEANFRWRLVSPATIERSTDGGITWTPQPIRSGEPLGLRSQNAMSPQLALPMTLTAGAAPSRNVCWVVGRAGLVLLTIDGTTWQTRPLSEAADLIAVRASDARTASLTAADGRQFSTTDGGATWVLVR